MSVGYRWLLQRSFWVLISLPLCETLHLHKITKWALLAYDWRCREECRGIFRHSTYFHFSQVRLGKSWLGIFESWACNSLGLNLWLQRCNFSFVRGLEMFMLLWYNGSSKKTTSGRSLRLAWGGRKYGVWIPTTPLTTYGFGLPGFSAAKSTRKQSIWTQKPRKSRKITQKIRFLAFGTSMPSVRIRPLRPKISRKWGFSPHFRLILCL